MQNAPHASKQPDGQTQSRIVRRNIAALVEERRRSESSRTVHDHIADAMTAQMKPAYERVAAFLTEDKPNAQAPASQGARALPQGAEFYKAMLYLQTTTDMTADQSVQESCPHA